MIIPRFLQTKENIKTFLWNEFGKEVLRTSVHGLPEYYKMFLLRKLDNNEDTKTS